MDDIQFAFTASDKIGRLYRDAKLFSIDTPALALPYLRGLASAFCDALDRDFAESDPLEGKIKSLESRGLLRPATRRNLRKLQRSGNIAAHPECYDFETHDFPTLANEALAAARELIEQLFDLRKEPAPPYEIADLGLSGMRTMCYEAMIEGNLEAIYRAAKYFKAKADQINLSETVLRSDGYGYQARHQIEQAMFWFKRGASSGHSECMYQYGAYLADDCESNDERKGEGERLIADAAAAGYADAQKYLADCLMYGHGIFSEDLEGAIEMYERAASQGHLAALAQLGGIYAQGIGCKPDAVKAAQYAIRAAEAGYPQAQYNLFVHYLSGFGVDQNNPEALKWLTEAAEQDFPAAMYELAILILDRVVEESDEAKAERLLKKAGADPMYAAKAALALAQLSLQTNSQVCRLEALTSLQFAYEAASKYGDPDGVMARCLSLSSEVVPEVRAHIVANGPDLASRCNDLLTCTLFDADGVPTTDRFERLGQFREVLSLMSSDSPSDKAKAIDLLMHRAGITPKGTRVYLRPQPKSQSVAHAGTAHKTGRNERCYCGSGKKFKYCCGKNH